MLEGETTTVTYSYEEKEGSCDLENTSVVPAQSPDDFEMVPLDVETTISDCEETCTTDTASPCTGYEYLDPPVDGNSCKHWYKELFVNADNAGQKCFI